METHDPKVPEPKSAEGQMGTSEEGEYHEPG
eukprot:CAMPEP_0202875620 /NCGR_PEP_ID=MMETSP1391-20130828/27611_1 /ASSEMBLY_ACC=CAM_ASM_000867 /TAXON_ID=1034604 /ORGANISM="Chlamydomonas leiostraca, Strain SAG 11-49" /LENGTH=30 /DNA_ID= /DNA_START= /DNA_END= /DNA_ORIENTATION=